MNFKPTPKRFCQSDGTSVSLFVLRTILSVLALFNDSVAAHESQPLYIELTETQLQRYKLQWKIPPTIPLSNAPRVTLPPGCKVQNRVAQFDTPEAIVRRVGYVCGSSIDGQLVAIEYPAGNPSVSSIIRYCARSGERHIAVLTPREMTWNIPQKETSSRVAIQYGRLGIEHIWAGADHLLFVACLLWIAGTGPRMLTTITGFTLAHSVTLIMSALHVIRLPTPPLEAGIALSLVFLASEIAKGHRQTITWRHPIAVSTSFGLLHGFGFAAALEKLGLPQLERLTGLLCFNVGVEIGQIMFAASTIGLTCVLQRLAPDWSANTPRVAAFRAIAAYAIGIPSVFLLIERCVEF